MRNCILITDMFRLPDGNTVLACEGVQPQESIIGRRAHLVSENNTLRQAIRLIGERSMLRQSLKIGTRALETSDHIDLSPTEAQSGRWRLLLQD